MMEQSYQEMKKTQPQITQSRGKKQRLPITRRAEKDELPGFRLTQRDIEIVKAVYTHRALSTPQIEALLFPSDNGQRHRTKTSRCRHRLKLLYHCGVLFRDEQPIKLRLGRKPLVYFLDRGAIPLLAEEFGVFCEDIGWKAKDNKVASRFIEHLLAINAVRVSVEVAAERNGLILRRWTDEKTLASQEMKDSVEIRGPRGGVLKATIVPDGYFYLSDGEHDFHNLLEVDRGTETVASNKFGRRDFSRKIRGYLAYYTSGRYEARYGSKLMHVLTVTTGRKRLTNLKTIAERLGGGDRDLFWFTTLDQVSTETVLTEPIWEIAGRDGVHPLIW
jgi:hypothetical protein